MTYRIPPPVELPEYSAEDWRRCAENVTRAAGDISRAYLAANQRIEALEETVRARDAELATARKEAAAANERVERLDSFMSDIAEALGWPRELPRASGYNCLVQIAKAAPRDWIEKLTADQLERLESACANWNTREEAAEGLRRALLLTARGVEVPWGRLTEERMAEAIAKAGAK